MNQQKALEKFFNLIIDYQNQIEDKNNKVSNYLTPKELKKAFDFSIKREGAKFNDLLSDIEEYLHHAVKTRSSNFFNQLFGGNNIPALMGDILTSITNTSMYTYEVAPLATIMELELVQKMCKKIGYKSGEGTFVTGGSNTNLMAMLCARNILHNTTKKSGIKRKFTAFTSEHCHYSIPKAANIIGIGEDNLIKIKTNKNGQLISKELDVAIYKSKQKGEIPFFISATAGTTKIGAIDPLEEISAIAKKHKLWFHIDGSWGGSILLSNKHKKLLKGSHLADSFSWNPHKLMNIPLICSVFLLKKQGILEKVVATPNADYLFHEHDFDEFDLGKYSIQCGKRADSLKLWMAWKFFGDQGYNERINRLFDMAKHATNIIVKHPKLELLKPTQTLNVNFRYIPKNKKDVCNFNLMVRNCLAKKGGSMVNYCSIDNNISIRFVLLNPDANIKGVNDFFNAFLSEAEMLDK